VPSGICNVLLTNCDAWYDRPLPLVAEGGDRMRLLVVEGTTRKDYGDWLYAGTAYLPWADVRTLPDAPAGLHEVSWREAWATNKLDVVRFSGLYIDCGTPEDLAAANRARAHE